MYHHHEEEDEWYPGGYPRAPSPRRYDHTYRRSSHHLSPDPQFQASMHRSRSHGHGPRPEINIYNEVAPDIRQAAYPPSPDLRGRPAVRLAEDMLAEDIAIMHLNARSRSRGYSDAALLYPRASSPNFAQWQLAQQATEERMKQRFELEQMQADAKRKAEDAAAKEREKQIVAEYERNKIEEKEKAKAAEIALMQRIEREKIEAKEKKEREYQEFLHEQREKKEKEEKKKKEEEEKLEAEMRDRLLASGLSDREIRRILRKKKSKDQIHTNELAMISFGGRTPVYPKVHRDYLEIATLRNYGLPYELDTADPNYIIILRELDKRETEVLFAHTKDLRKKALLIEESKDDRPKYAWVRHRDRSRSVGRKAKVIEIHTGR